MLMALLLDAANIAGGLLLAIPLLSRFPAITRVAARIARWQWLVGLLALVAGGYYLIVHMISGPRVFHFEVVGIAVGVILAWDRLTGRKPLLATTGSTSTAAARGWPTAGSPPASAEPTPTPPAAPTDLRGPALLIAVFGLIAILVGIQGLFTPN